MGDQNTLFFLETYFAKLGVVRRKYRFAAASFREFSNQVAQKSRIFVGTKSFPRVSCCGPWQKKKKSSAQNTTLIKKQICFYHWEVTSDNVFSKDGVWGLGIFSCDYSQVVVL